MAIPVPEVGNLVLGAGTLGTAAFGIVEALKWTPLGAAGFGRIKATLGVPLLAALKIAYGDDSEKLLRAQYCKGGGRDELARSLRQGVRVGLKAEHAEALAASAGAVVNAADLKSAIESIAAGRDLDSTQRNVIGRFELAVDARIDSALALAQDTYLGSIRLAASAVAIGMALLSAMLLEVNLIWGWVVGIAAVPLAPIANDVVGALQAATRAMKGRA